MPITLSQIQCSANLISSRCANKDGTPLTKSQKRHVSEQITHHVHGYFQKKKPQVIVLNPNNLALKELFECLEADLILFPKDTTYLIKGCGKSIEKTYQHSLDLNHRMRCLIDEVLKDISDACQSMSSNPVLEEIELLLNILCRQSITRFPHSILIKEGNSDFKPLYQLLRQHGVSLPQEHAYLMRNTGQCAKWIQGERKVLYEPNVLTYTLYDHKDRNKKPTLKALTKQLREFHLAHPFDLEDSVSPAPLTFGFRNSTSKSTHREETSKASRPRKYVG